MDLWMFEFFQRRFRNGQVPAWIPILGAVVLAAALFVAFRRGLSRKAHEPRIAAWLLILYCIYLPFFLWWDATEPRWFNLSNIFWQGW